MIKTANVATVPINHNALSVIVETNCVIAPAFAGARPVTPAARNASTCASATTPYTDANTTPTHRRHPAKSNNIESLPARDINTAETPRTSHRPHRAIAPAAPARASPPPSQRPQGSSRAEASARPELLARAVETRPA